MTNNKVIQSLWVGSHLSTMEQMSAKSFLHHGHEYHLYIYGDVKNIPTGVTVRDANEIIPESDIQRFASLANFSDWFRFVMLSKIGGWWADIDSVCVKPFDFADEYVFCSEIGVMGRASIGELNSSNIKSPAGSPAMQWCVDRIKSKDTHKTLWSELGPYMIRDVVDTFKLRKFVQPGIVFTPVRWQDCPKKLINPNLPNTLTNRTYAVHLYNEVWVPSASRIATGCDPTKYDKDASYPKTCLYERFKRGEFTIPEEMQGVNTRPVHARQGYCRKHKTLGCVHCSMDQGIRY